MNFKRLVIILSVILCVATAAHAQDANQTDRQGFYLNLGLGLAYEMNQFEKTGGAFSVELGYGVNEQFIVYADIQDYYTQIEGLDSYLYDFMAKVKYIINLDQPVYLTGGIGMSKGSVEANGSTYTTDAGLAIDVGVGYEFRRWNKFFIAPEVSLSIRSIDDITYTTPSAMCNFGWYF